MRYQTLCDFRDLEDGHLYRAGVPFPYDGRDIAAKRIEELSGTNNKAGKPLIAVAAEAQESSEAKTSNKRRRTKAKE